MRPSPFRGPVYLTMASLAKKLDFATADAAADWVERRGIPRYARSQKCWTVRESDVDAAMEGRAFPAKGGADAVVDVVPGRRGGHGRRGVHPRPLHGGESAGL